MKTLTTIGRAFVATLATVLTGAIAPLSVAGQTDQRAIATALRSGNADLAKNALQMALKIPPSSIAIELREALIEQLTLKNRVVESARRQGIALSTVDDPSDIASLSRLVAGLQHPGAIQALAEAHYGGERVKMALASFGERAVPALLEVASSDKHYDVVNHALGALTRMIQSPSGVALSTNSRVKVANVARAHLTGRPYFSTLWKAIELAASLQESSLDALVESLASSDSAVQARGIDDPVVAARTKEFARERLRRRGLPPG